MTLLCPYSGGHHLHQTQQHELLLHVDHAYLTSKNLAWLGGLGSLPKISTPSLDIEKEFQLFQLNLFGGFR